MANIMDSQGKLLLMSFVTILIGVILIQPIANDIETVSTSSISVLNETLTFANSTTAVVNESNAVGGNTTFAFNITLEYDDLTTFTELRNSSATVVNGLCNVTLSLGRLQCNVTNSTNLFSDYTYIARMTETLANDELISLSAIRNRTAGVITGACNVTLTTGNLVCNNTHSPTSYADYAYTPDTYVRSASARTLLGTTRLFFALTIMIFGAGMAVLAFRRAGLF